MKKSFFIALGASLVLASCQQNSTKTKVVDQKLTEEAIAIHDEIMPQIALFDRNTVKIDSLLANLSEIKKTNSLIDTAALKGELTTLKSNLEDATDNMMTWMKDYNPDSTDIDYQKAEVEKIRTMKKQFEDVSTESSKKLSVIK
ncbi:transposase [Sphingobacterium pedocola]|uniref:Transposase n=1 Tax=Sphingobacterium pedocola TaxID=2082722 RepID=A0ABR9T6I8_9SPHI|nr:transposase [Sphingobacterium pedocola]MBE8720960.1 transposase [Sphingobacterium pedocola]